MRTCCQPLMTRVTRAASKAIYTRTISAASYRQSEWLCLVQECDKWGLEFRRYVLPRKLQLILVANI